MARVIILDTSFLLELLAVPQDSTLIKTTAAKELIADAIENNYDVFCPLSVLYEVANHIVDIKHQLIQRQIADTFKEMVDGSFSDNIPFTIIPGGNYSPVFKELSELPELCRVYQVSIRQGLGLTDCTIIDVANSLKRNYTDRKKAWPTHIWTTHAALRAMAPDAFVHQYF